MPSQFFGKVILVVEDNPLIALDITDSLEIEGAKVIGPVGTVKAAFAALADSMVDAALLDINLTVETSYPVADYLLAEGIPFAFVTSMEKQVVPEGYRGYVISKSASLGAIEQVLFPS